MRQELTTSPVALANITADTRYTIQNRSSHVVYIQTAATAPTESGNAFVMFSSGPISAGVFRASGSDNVYVWADDISLGAGAVVYDEAA